MMMEIMNKSRLAEACYSYPSHCKMRQRGLRSRLTASPVPPPTEAAFRRQFALHRLTRIRSTCVISCYSGGQPAKIRGKIKVDRPSVERDCTLGTTSPLTRITIVGGTFLAVALIAHVTERQKE
jgi:hypothetical protein